MLSSGDNFPHLIQKRRSQLGFVTYLLNYPRIIPTDAQEKCFKRSVKKFTLKMLQHVSV